MSQSCSYSQIVFCLNLCEHTEIYTTAVVTLLSVCRAEREKARLQQQSISNKLFIFEGTDDAGYPVYTPAPQVQKVCQEVDGFIYVANAEPGKGEGKFNLFSFFAAIGNV